jgi:hypothetical protein
MPAVADPTKTGLIVGASLLAASAVALSVTGNTNETVLATVSIPAGSMGLNGGVVVKSTWSHTNSANSKTLRIRFGGVSGTAYLSYGATTTATLTETERRIRNRNSASSQVGNAPTGVQSGGSSGAIPTSAVDTTAVVDIVISGQLALGSESITLENYEVWLLPG